MTAQVLRYAAFTDGGQGGNPAGVVLDADRLGDAEMLRVARTIGYSETAFVTTGSVPDTSGLRFFSPQAEVAFCGHATVATSVALADHHGPGDLRFETMAGVVDVRTESSGGGTKIATLVSPPTSTRTASADEVRRTLDALRWSAQDLDPAMHRTCRLRRQPPPGAGRPYERAPRRPRLRLRSDLGGLMAERGWTTVDLVHRESDSVFHARNPFPPGGVVEDPATGAAAAAFGGYLRDLGLVDVPGAGDGAPRSRHGCAEPTADCREQRRHPGPRDRGRHPAAALALRHARCPLRAARSHRGHVQADAGSRGPGDGCTASPTAWRRPPSAALIEHHLGAIEMAQTEQNDGENSDAIDLARTIESAQTTEIATMQALLGS